MKPIRNPFKIDALYMALAVIWLAACTATPITVESPTFTLEVETSSLVPTATPTLLPAHTETPKADLWEIQKCRQGPSVVPDDESRWISEYVGDMEGRGEIDMLLNFTEGNEIHGFAFDFEQVREYRINGCVERRTFTMWLQQGDTVEAVIRGEFPETDPRGHFSSSDPLQFEVITGSLVEKSDSESLQIYLRMTSSMSGTMEHRFQLAGVDDDAIILNASEQFLTAITQDDRAQVVEMLRFPVEVRIHSDELKEIQTPESFLAQYDDIFDQGFRERLAITFPNYLVANSGNFVGIIGQFVYGGGGISFDEHGKVVGIYNWETPAPTPTVISSGSP